jgi:ABC-type multidrug transport system fused ATPase/permease subunit
MKKTKKIERSLIKSDIKKIFGLFSKRDQKILAASIIAQFALALLDLIAVGLIGAIGSLAIRGLSASGPGDQVSILLSVLSIENLGFQSQILVIGFLAASLMVFKTLSSIYLTRRTLFFISRRSAVISSKLVKNLLQQDLTFLRKSNSQETLYSITSGIDLLTLGVIGSISIMISDVSLTLILALGLFVFDPLIALLSFVFFVLVAWAVSRGTDLRSQNISIAQTKLNIESNQRILEVLGAIKEIYTKNRRNFYIEKISKSRFQLAHFRAERVFLPNLSKYIFEVATVIAAISISGMQFLIHDGVRAVAMLTLFMAASARISPAILRIQQNITLIKSNLLSAGPTFDLMKRLELEIPNFTARPEVTGIFSPRIQIANVNYRYPESIAPVLKSVTLEIAPGEVVAFVGPSGAGKSTLVDLILGLIKPDSGSILISGLPSNQAIQEFEGHIAYVPQDCLIFEGTLAENVCLGYDTSEFEDQAIIESLRIAQLDSLYRENHLGIHMKVGERGTRLSGGQRQRIGIARAVLSKPELIILDEATSALDSQTEKEISDSILSLKGSSTILLIAHRLSTILNADKVVYLEQGEILCVGSFEQVKAKVPNFEAQAGLMGL